CARGRKYADDDGYQFYWFFDLW
nr:immunoglobulin heavy chain junction region [Macaca mulatta]MOW80235.1 immunoglobulin heavy chain junction region [Macaca mulatta]MOW80990.1 immunoglobulin heavy chain junction region [Macaca mulatta]MOW82419.1 immunoglobulin heavy chain junction region [Macaca mulatta]MOW84056.1 immunoglobulin heavy chain junction region [Macaca mulatta]